ILFWCKVSWSSQVRKEEHTTGESPWASMAESIWERASAARASNRPPGMSASSTVKSRGRGWSWFTRRRYQGVSAGVGLGVGEGSRSTKIPGAAVASVAEETGAEEEEEGVASGRPWALAGGTRWGNRPSRKRAQAAPGRTASSQRRLF